MGIKAVTSGISKTNTNVGHRPTGGMKSSMGGGKATRHKTGDRSRTMSDMSGNCGKLAAGPCDPKPGGGKGGK